MEHFMCVIWLGVIVPNSSFYDYELTIGRRSGRVIKRNSNSFAKMKSILLRYNQDDIENIEDTENNIIWWCIRKTDIFPTRTGDV